MKTFTEHIVINTKKRIEFINLTDKIEKIVEKSNIKEGIVLVNAMHITSSIFVNDAESGLLRDFEEWLERLAPKDFNYNHHNTGEDNGFSHLWRQIMGRESVIAITGGKLDFGPWEQVYYGEFDGQRDKRVLIKIIGE